MAPISKDGLSYYEAKAKWEADVARMGDKVSARKKKFVAKITPQAPKRKLPKMPIVRPADPDEVEAPKGKQYCPMCEKPVRVHESYVKDTYDVRGHKITVRAPQFRCLSCGEEWVHSHTEDGLEKAFTIYVKRTNFETRKFKKLYFKNSKCSALVCPSCADKFGYKPGVVAKKVRTSKRCSSKGGSNQAHYRVLLGTIK